MKRVVKNKNYYATISSRLYAVPQDNGVWSTKTKKKLPVGAVITCYSPTNADKYLKCLNSENPIQSFKKARFSYKRKHFRVIGTKKDINSNKVIALLVEY